MRKLKMRIAAWMIDEAVKMLPLATRKYGEAHHVGDRWLTWSVEKVDGELERYMETFKRYQI